MKIKKGFAALKPRTHSYLADNKDEDKEEKGLKTCVL